MNKIYGIILLFAVTMCACFEDEGNYDYRAIGEIGIDSIRPAYSKYSYVGDVLEITPTVTTKYANIKYEWRIWKGTGTGYISIDDEQIESELIGEGKDLSYEVNLAPGDYTIMFRATAENGYAALQTATLEVSTQFARGFYILKETAEGASELDLLYSDGEPMIENVLSTTGQQPLSGRPLFMGPVYLQGFINKVTNKVDECNAIFVSTEDGNIAFYNTDDMSVVHDNSDATYGGLPAGTNPYMALSSGYYNYLFTSDGTYSAQAMAGYPSSAYAPLGTSAVRCVSMFSIDLGGGWFLPSLIYYDELNHCVDYEDGMGKMFGPIDYKDYSTEGMDCLMCGYTASNSCCYFLLEDESGMRCLDEVEISPVMFSISYKDRITINPSSKLANANHFTVNADGFNYLYYVHDNKLYAYSLDSRDEGNVPITLEGIGAGEEIVYLSYQWMNCAADAASSTNFTHLVVGTQDSDTYRVYMYNIAGGEPRELVRTITGTGKLKSVAYISPRFNAEGGDSYSFPN